MLMLPMPQHICAIAEICFRRQSLHYFARRRLRRLIRHIRHTLNVNEITEHHEETEYRCSGAFAIIHMPRHARCQMRRLLFYYCARPFISRRAVDHYDDIDATRAMMLTRHTCARVMLRAQCRAPPFIDFVDTRASFAAYASYAGFCHAAIDYFDFADAALRQELIATPLRAAICRYSYAAYLMLPPA